MFGNLTGWIISAVMVVIAAVIGFQILSAATPTPASGWVDGKVKLAGLDDLARPILPVMDNMKDDAGDLYRQAAADYAANEKNYDSFEAAKSLKDIEYDSMHGIQAILNATHCQSMDLFRTRPEEVVGFETDVMVLNNLQKVADAMSQVAVLAWKENNYDLAQQYAVALQMLGYRLYKERAAYEELKIGESILGNADQLLMSLAKDQKQADKQEVEKQFDSARVTEYKDKIDPVRQVLIALSPQNLRDHTGDFYQMAGDPTVDRVWRVEAIRRIGRLYFNAENKSDQTKARKFLARIASDTSNESIIRAAATVAGNMTAKDNQCLR